MGKWPRQAWRIWWGDWWNAVAFLTTLPAPRVPFSPDGLGRAAVWFPAVGLLIGLVLCLVAWVAHYLFDPWLAGALVVAAWAALTGALHLDGLADCCDGLFAPVPPERRLEILRDPRVGGFGAVGLILHLLLKSAAAGSAPAAALLLAPAWARWLLLIAARQPQARRTGMGASFAAGLTPGALAIAALLPLALAIILAPLRGGAALLVALAAVWAALALARRRLGGVTGDVYGLVVELAELAALLVFAAQPLGG